MQILILIETLLKSTKITNMAKLYEILCKSSLKNKNELIQKCDTKVWYTKFKFKLGLG